MSPHSYILESGIADSNGYVNIDKYTLQHVKYPNIWSLGDCSNLPTTKSAAAVFAQSKILIKYFKNKLEI
jgi:sulfide:quinone oxidoreductase